jgi:hypothetical protein
MLASPSKEKHVYATTYFRSIRLRDDHFQTLQRHSLKAEIYFQFGWDKLTATEHQELAKIVAGELPGCGIHLPYLNSEPGHSVGRKENLKELRECLEIVAFYNPDHLIGHPYFDTLRDAISGVRKFLGLKKGPLI